MAKIIKYNTVNVDNDNVVNIELPTFEISPYAPQPLVNEEKKEQEEKEEKEKEEEKDDEISEQEAENRSKEILEMARIQSETMIYNAEQEGRNIIEKSKNLARVECEELYSKAKQNGYDDGYNAGKAQADKLIEQAQQYSEETVKEREKAIADVEPMVIELAVKTVENILSAAAVNPRITACLIKKGLSDTKLSGDIFIHVPQEHYSEITDKKTELGLVSDSNATIEIIKDMSLKEGDCIIETPFGNIDCSIDVQFSAIKENMMYLLSGR